MENDYTPDCEKKYDPALILTKEKGVSRMLANPFIFLVELVGIEPTTS